MKIKRFIAPDTRQVLRLVREELGPDAVVLSSRRSDEGAEVIVAIDYDEKSVTDMAAQARPEGSSTNLSASNNQIIYPSIGHPNSRQSTMSPSEEQDEPYARQPTALPTEKRDESLEGLGNELRRLRVNLEHELRYLRKQDPDPIRGEVLSLLEQLGIGPALAEGIAAKIVREGHAPEHVWKAARAALSKQIAVTENDVVHDGGVMALIGPTGVGKTTTIAKLAARFALRFGRKHIALVTTDMHRIGAQEQLLTFGETLGIPVEPASNRIELRQLIERHSPKKLVLIDNAGLGQRDLRLAAQLVDLECVPSIKTYLVISCTVQSAGLDEVFSAFGKTRLQGCILTKLDEAVSLGPAIQTLAHYRLPLAYACDGQRIPEDIHHQSSEDLVSRAENLAQAGAPRFAPEHNYYSRRLVANGLA
jgi:flagellar biosynthesis protein FlhF